ncbi:polyprenol phosphomannose-dependent alpha 1,6 mannosyltransferase MptB [Amycolatopsis sp. CA-230715]|uniref:polyprenol phosphomannose-dependent alpha 1,6 mannosyltransferase MptB n=1 Tax=Amycolatopsis sp. CA-230715 TaxID=2745196 RepID=UPI001C33D828|nr:polyprenol phosphomannose-dependent alpha 1,6 mannosyltransferase MptB [Amycolatopsis sp. CA-230715]QWF78474.1 Alpha-(1->6)-mannopyranosyltransferase [Amycolatopsis sp. CA-230715]
MAVSRISAPEIAGTSALPLEEGERRALDVVRRLGTVGALLLAAGSLGAGAAPVLNPVQDIPVLRLFIRIPTVSLAVAFAGMAMMVIAWLLLGRFARPGNARMASNRQLSRTLAMWLTPLVAIPPLFSRDVYAYLAQSEIVHRGMDPYSLGPAAALGVGDPLTANVSLLWRETSPPYGPLYFRLGGWLAGISGNNTILGVLLHRGLALIGVALIVWAAARLAKRFGVPPATALWLGAINPLVLFHLVAGAHNDSLAIGLMMAGLELGLRRLPARVKGDSPPPLADGELLFIALGTAVITVGVSVKLYAIVALPFFAVMVARRWHGRVADLVRAAVPMFVVFAVVLVAVCLGSGLGFGWVANLGTPGLVRSLLSPVAELVSLGGLLGIALGLGNHTEGLVPILNVLGYATAAAITLKFLWASFRWRYRPIIGLGVSLGAVMVLQVTLQPWYLLWAVIPLAAAAGTSRFRVAATAVSVVLSLASYPNGGTYGGSSFVVVQAIVAALVVVALAVVIVARVEPQLIRRPDGSWFSAAAGPPTSGS